jgi:hypothetical protein
MVNGEVGQLLHALSTQPREQARNNVVRNRVDVYRVLVGLESTMRPMTSRGKNYDTALEEAVNFMAMKIKNNPDVEAAREQLDNILGCLGEMNAPPNESARITMIENKVTQVRAILRPAN